MLFFILNAIGMAIAAGCLAFSRYVLDLHTQLADNIAANVIGLGLGTLFRFWSYRKWVFREEMALDEAEHTEARSVGEAAERIARQAADNESTGDIPVIR